MVFSSSLFLLGFLPLVFLGNCLLKTRYSNLFLLAASLVFYAWGEPVMVLLMIGSILLNWGVGRWLALASDRGRKVALVLGVCCNLGLLGYYKYAGFLVRLLNDVAGRNWLPVPQIALPIGISFFTFQAISYLVDVYRGETEPSPHLVNVALYISFFPQLIAGPIVKYRDIHHQLMERKISWIGVSDGFRRFLFGLGKKVLIANTLGFCADQIYSCHFTQIDALAAWIGTLAYTFQIYYDFSGYSDMAIGLGQMFGFTIPENFRYPYLSTSISEFWRRWHISLGSWFREYVYIPLGGNRKGRGRTLLHLMIVFALTGLWHGADVSFLVWGLYHGCFSLAERMGGKKILDRHPALGGIYTFLAVHFGWVLFRANSTEYGVRLLSRMLLPWRYLANPIPRWQYLDLKTGFAFLLALAGMGTLQKLIPDRWKDAWRHSVLEALFLIAVLLLCLAAIAQDSYNPFIYFQF
ncbi:MAG: MBOAT family protein [Clostridia bacterium]|nr:MBOAT family protein [Clostridia bacterium]